MYVQCIPNIFDHLATEGPIKVQEVGKDRKINNGGGYVY